MRRRARTLETPFTGPLRDNTNVFNDDNHEVKTMAQTPTLNVTISDHRIHKHLTKDSNCQSKAR
jgi:hypothetical protein